MSDLLNSLWGAVWGLLVDDGQLAVGVVGSLLATWTLVSLGNDLLGKAAGWLLVMMLVVVMIATLMRAAANARREASRSGASSDEAARRDTRT